MLPAWVQPSLCSSCRNTPTRDFLGERQHNPDAPHPLGLLRARQTLRRPPNRQFLERSCVVAFPEAQNHAKFGDAKRSIGGSVVRVNPRQVSTYRVPGMAEQFDRPLVAN